jgi:hypothetical protein
VRGTPALRADRDPVLLRTALTWREHGHRFQVIAEPRNIRRLFELTGASEILLPRDGEDGTFVSAGSSEES